MIEQLLYTQLGTIAALTTLVGDRIFPYRLAPDTLAPAITYQLVEAPEQLNLSGGSGLHRSIYRFFCYGSSYSDAVAVDEALVAGLSGWTASSGGVTIQSTNLRNRLDYDDPETKLLVRVVDIIIWHYGR